MDKGELTHFANRFTVHRMEVLETPLETLQSQPEEKVSQQVLAARHARPNRGILKAYRDACEQQELLMRDIRASETTPTQRAACVRAWTELEERKRILRGRPLPGQLRPEAKRKSANALGGTQ
jgi:hypothetical protein